MSRQATVLLGLTALLCLRGSSCLRTERPYGAPKAAELVAHLRSRAARVRTVRAETRMSHRTSQGKVKATVRLMAALGGKLRFDAVSPFDTPLATLVSDGTRFALVDAQKNRHYHGPASPCNIARLLQVALQPAEVLTVLAGGTPIIAHSSARVEWDGRAAAEVLTLQGDDLVQTIRLDGTGRRWDLLLSELRTRKGELLLRIEPGDYRRVDSLRLPGRLQMSQPGNKAELDVVFRGEEVNLKLPSAAFELPGAEGMPSQLVECTTVITAPGEDKR